MTAPLSEDRLAEIRAMRFETGLNAACGHFDTPVERELYRLAALNHNARLELLAEIDRLRELVATTETRAVACRFVREHGDPFGWCEETKADYERELAAAGGAVTR